MRQEKYETEKLLRVLNFSYDKFIIYFYKI